MGEFLADCRQISENHSSGAQNESTHLQNIPKKLTGYILFSFSFLYFNFSLSDKKFQHEKALTRD